MKSLCMALTLILCVSLSTLPTSTATTTLPEDKLYTAEMQTQVDTLPEDLRADLVTATDSLKEYAVTHTSEDTMTYAKILLDQMTYEALEWDGGGETLNPDGLYDDAPSFLVPNGDAPLEFYGSDSDRRRRCILDHLEACRNEYNAELFQSAAIGTGVFLGCGALTAGSGIILCAAGGLAVHALGIAAARQRRAACEARAPYQCQ